MNEALTLTLMMTEAARARRDAKRARDVADRLDTLRFEVRGGRLVEILPDGREVDVGDVVGPAGRDGKDGRNGTDGAAGVDGKNGRDGKDGRNGTDGLPGMHGRDGSDGKDGRDAATIIAVDVAPDGKLTITLSDGRVLKSRNPVPARTITQTVRSGGGVPKAEIERMIAEAVISTVIVDTIADRDALTPTNGQQVLVIDATGDPTVDSGAATYVWREDPGEWIKLSEAESMDVVLDWSKIQNGPASTPAEIDAAVAAVGVPVLTWVHLAAEWSVAPAEIGSTAAGAVWQYVAGDVTRFRLVPDPYNATGDAFYTGWDGAALSGLIVSRG